MRTHKSEREKKQMKLASDLLVKTHKEIAKMIKPGITTMDIDTFVEEFLAKHGATPEQKGFQGYEYATGASIYDEICHGFPRSQKVVNVDIVTNDLAVNLNVGLADTAWAYVVGERVPAV